MPVLHSYVRNRVVMSPVDPGANSDAAKLQHLVVGLRWKRVRISSDRLVLHAATTCVRATGMLRWQAVSKHVRIFLKTDSLWRTHYAHLARQCCVPRTPCGIWFPENISRPGLAAHRRHGLCSGSTHWRTRRRRSLA